MHEMFKHFFSEKKKKKKIQKKKKKNETKKTTRNFNLSYAEFTQRDVKVKYTFSDSGNVNISCI